MRTPPGPLPSRKQPTTGWMLASGHLQNTSTWMITCVIALLPPDQYTHLKANTALVAN